MDDKQHQALGSVLSGKHTCIVGSGGTGKSFVVKKLVEYLEARKKSVAVTAPTGIAAIQINGFTLHSWAGVGTMNKDVGYYVKVIRCFGSTALHNWTKTDVLIIDEMSMLSEFTFDFLDTLARRIRNDNAPFGGLQLVLVGDPKQLPPVAMKHEVPSKRRFCFLSDKWKKMFKGSVIVFTKQYRQGGDLEYAELLERVGLGTVIAEDIQLLRKCVRKPPKSQTDMIHLYTTNRAANERNQVCFEKLETPIVKIITEDAFHLAPGVAKNPARREMIMKTLEASSRFERVCHFRVGAFVMLCKNLAHYEGWANGSCGYIVAFDGRTPLVVREKQDYLSLKDKPITTIRAHPDVIAVVFDKVESIYVRGFGEATRSGIPLRLAWGITIHKSQGSQFSEAYVDVSRIFEDGQIYVALSRVMSTDGLYLSTLPHKFRTSPHAIEFYRLYST